MMKKYYNAPLAEILGFNEDVIVMSTVEDPTTGVQIGGTGDDWGLSDGFGY
jgi:hypothetical protein